MRRAARVAFWLVPSLLCLAIYWNGLRVYFLQDDFAWLGLRLSIWDFHSLLDALFSPKAQGTIRPISERGYFLLLSTLFGLNPLPFRIVAFATMMGNLALLAAIVRRLTGNTVAAVMATLLWLANSALVSPMSWSSAYNEILCSTVFLAGIYLLLRFIENDDWRFYWAQVAVFLVGFGVLEINIIYPAIAAACLLLYSRRHVKFVLPLFAVSAAYTALHFWAATKAPSGVYAMHYDLSVVDTYFRYVWGALSGGGIQKITHTPEWVVTVSPWVLGLAAVAFAAWKATRRRWLPLFGVAWFTLVLAPVLPLRDHYSDYYLTIPLIGLAFLGAEAVRDALLASWRLRVPVALLVGLYLYLNLPFTMFAMKWTCRRSDSMRTLANGLARAHELHPGKTILLAGITGEQFWGGFYDGLPRLLDVEAYLLPDTESQIDVHPDAGSIQSFVMPRTVARKALLGGHAVAYTVDGSTLRNVTRKYRAIAVSEWETGVPRHVEIGQPLYEDQVGDGWYPIEGSFRWSKLESTVYLGGPTGPGQNLIVHGYCPTEQFRDGPVGLAASVDGKSLGTQMISGPDAEFFLTFPLPPESVGKSKLTIIIRISRAYRAPNEHRVLGMAFGSLSIR